MIQKVLDMIAFFLVEETTDATKFSIDLEDMIFDYYDEM